GCSGRDRRNAGRLRSPEARGNSSRERFADCAARRRHRRLLRVLDRLALVSFARAFALCACLAAPLSAQLPFYTDDPAVTERGKFHFEFFNEFDALQHQYPNVRQNTTSYKLNYGLPHGLELDVDFPYLSIFRLLET